MQIVITFIIAIAPEEKKPKKAKKAKQPKKSSKKSSKSSKKSSKSSKSDKSSSVATESTAKTDTAVPNADIIEIDDFLRYEVEKPLSYIHIQYSMLPESSAPYEIDILCWKHVSKLFTSDGEKVLKNIVEGNNSWISFSISHNFCLKSEQIIKLRDYVVEITITSNKSKMGGRAMNEENKFFYMYKYNTDVRAKVFSARFFENIPTSSKLEFSHIKEILAECSNKQANFYDQVDVLKFCPVLNHQKYIFDEIKFAQEKNFILEPIEGQDATKLLKMAGKKGKKGKKKKSKKKGGKDGAKFKGTITLKLKSEALFEERKLSFRRGAGGASGLRYCAAILAAKDVMTPKQRRRFQPVIIEIRDLTDLPVDALTEARITHLYAKYKYIVGKEITTLAYPVAPEVNFNEPRVLLLHRVDENVLMEHLQSVPLFVEIYGIRSPIPEDKFPLVYTKHPVDKFLSQPVTAETLPRLQQLRRPCPKPVLLALARFDLSELLEYGCSTVDSSSGCLPPDAAEMADYAMDERKAKETRDIKDIVISRVYTRPNCPSSLHERGVLLDSGVNLGIRAVLQVPLRARLQASVVQGNLFNRIYVELSDFSLVFDLLTSITSFNSQYGVFAEPMKLPADGSVVSVRDSEDDVEVQRIEVEIAEHSLNSAGSFDSQKQLVTSSGCLFDDTMFTERDAKAITGFAIDTVDKYDGKFIIFLEGQAHGYLQNIWLKLMHLTPEQGKVYYKDDCIFQKRLYEFFLDQYGVFGIRLQPSFQDLLRTQVYLGDNPCAETLRRLSLLMSSCSLKSVNQCRLYPTTGGLLDLRRKYGGALHASARAGSGLFRSASSSTSQIDSMLGSLRYKSRTIFVALNNRPDALHIISNNYDRLRLQLP